MMITFTSDHIITERGFQLDYTSVNSASTNSSVEATTTALPQPPTDSPWATTETGGQQNSTDEPRTEVVTSVAQNETCGSPSSPIVLTAPTGTITSPNYPGNYPNNAYCAWRIIAQPGQVVSVNITYFCTESCCDFVSFYDGPDTSSSLIQRVAGCYSSPWTVVSTQLYMMIVFTSDHSVTRQGFHLEYTSAYSDNPTTASPISDAATTASPMPETGTTASPISGNAVAFFAYNDRRVFPNPLPGIPLQFNGVNPNLNNHVTARETFIAPTAGYYYFCLSAGALENDTLDYALAVGGNREVAITRTATDHTGVDTTSRDYMRYLTTGQAVNIMSTSYGLYSDYEVQTSWTGFALSELVGRGSEVAFMVAHSRSESGFLDPFRFDHLFVSEGGGYNTSSNSFVAPSSGLYFFHISVGHQPGQRVNFDLRLNGGPFIDLFRQSNTHNGVDTTSRSVLVQLNAFDELHVVNNFGSAIYSDGEYQTSFSGFKYQPINGQQVAWHVSRSSVWLGNSDSMYPVEYQHVEVNVGLPQPWNPTENQVVIQREGYYFIHLSTGTIDGYRVNYSLTRNGLLVADILRQSTHQNEFDTISRSGMAYLYAGDVLRVGAGHGTAMYSNEERQTSFTGFLLWAA